MSNRYSLPPFAVSVFHEDGSLLLALAGELDIATRPVLREVVRELLSPHLRAVTLDLAGLDFVDVIGLRALVDVKAMVAGVQADFRLRSVSDSTLKVIRLAKFDELDPEPSSTPGVSDRRRAPR